MKKILFTMLVMALALFVFASCSNKPKPGTIPSNSGDTATPNESAQENNDSEFDTRFDNTVEDAVSCYFSLLTEDGYGNYILSFPEEFIRGYQHIALEYDDAQFKEAIDNDIYSAHANRDEKYMGNEFHIDYKYISDVEVTGDKKEALISDLVNYCYMSRSSIEKVVEYTYDVQTYGINVATDEVYNHEQENKKLTLLYISGAGWYVSPTNFELNK